MQQRIKKGMENMIFRTGLTFFLVASPVMPCAAEDRPQEPKSRLTNSLGMMFAYVPPGTFKEALKALTASHMLCFPEK